MHPHIASARLYTYALALIATCIPGVAAAAPIAITGGSLDAKGVMGSGPLVLDGDRGFTFLGWTGNGVYAPGLCPCLGGDRISLLASWGGSWDVSGVATLDGITYPRVGDPDGLAAMTVVFDGSLLLPTEGGATTLVAPFIFTATFYHPGGPDLLTGSGMATISLTPVPGYPDTLWFVKEVVYRLGSRLVSPWVTEDIGPSTTAGSASLVDDTFVVAGEGADIWGTADSFRFASLQLPGAGAVTARVVTQDKAYPSRSGAAAALQPFAKSGVMIRESTQPGAPSVVVDVKPDGEIEFMARYAANEQTMYLGGVMTPGQNVWLTLSRAQGGEITASYSLDGLAWTILGTVSLDLHSTELLAGLAVTSHEASVLDGTLFDHVAVTAESSSSNLLVRGDFEGYQPPALGLPGWVSDDALRQVSAKSETNQPRSGAKNGACWTTQYLDCGLYQEVVAPVTGLYTLQMYATADRSGGLVGANVNGATAASSGVVPHGFGAYAAYGMTFTATAGDVIRVWMYSPASPGYVVVDDATLTASTATRPITSGTWTINTIAGAFGAFTLSGDQMSLDGTYDGGAVEPMNVCGSPGCAVGTQMGLSTSFINQTPVTFVSFARGKAVVDGVSYLPFVEFGGALTLHGGAVVLPAPSGTTWPELVSVSAPFAMSGVLKGFDVVGRRDPLLVFALPLTGGGTATAEFLAAPNAAGTVVLRFYRLRYDFNG